MKKKLVLVLALLLNVMGCSENVNGVVASKTLNPIAKSTTSQKAELVKVIVKGSNFNKTYNKPKDIKVFRDALNTGVVKKMANEQLKAPPYFMYFYFSDNKNKSVEYFLYINPTNGWIYKNGTLEKYILSQKSHNDLYKKFK